MTNSPHVLSNGYSTVNKRFPVEISKKTTSIEVSDRGKKFTVKLLFDGGLIESKVCDSMIKAQKIVDKWMRQ